MNVSKTHGLTLILNCVAGSIKMMHKETGTKEVQNYILGLYRQVVKAHILLQMMCNLFFPFQICVGSHNE